MGINQELIFSLNNTSDFWIAEGGGNIFTQRSFNYEDGDFLQATIIVRDNGTNSLMSTSTLQVYITDLNDNNPYFVNFVNRTLTLSEDTAVSTAILDIDAMDEDSTTNAQVSCLREPR